MRKFYIKCGRLEKVLIAETPEDAAWKAVLQAKGETLDYFFYVDERGFRPQAESDYFTCDTDCLPMWSIPYSQVVEENDYEN